MQPLTATQRDLLTGDRLEVSAGLELLDLDLTVIDDLSDSLVGGKVSRNCHARIHGTCRLGLSTSLEWGRQLVRPYMTLSDGTVEARFDLGVFMLTSPEVKVGESLPVHEVHGYDRLYLLDREVGAEYTVAAGTTYRAAILKVFTDAGLSGVLIDGDAADDTLPQVRTWALVGQSTDPDDTSQPVTWLRIVNDLLTAINYRAVWADQAGRFRCHRYVDPTARGTEFVFDATDPAVDIVGEDRTRIEDVWKTPNRWVFIRSNGGTGVEGDGVYTVVNQSDGPLSIDARGLVWTRVFEYEAASQAKLVALGDRRVAQDRRSTVGFKVTTGVFPAAGHFDLFDFRDPDMGTRRVQAVRWELDVTGGDTSWEWQAVTA